MVRRTFAFTDVEGSTSLWEKAGSLFRRALDHHDALIRAEIERHGGQELTETGDGFLIAFEEADTAAECAVAIQRQLERAQWPDVIGRLRARIGLHSGDVDPRGDEYRGIVLNRAARVLAAAHGGQIVCSSATAAELGSQWDLLPLGVFRLRGLSAPERLLQLCWPGMPQRDFLPLNALPAFTSNLPRALTRFFGRIAELEKLRGELLAGSPTGEGLLLTLTGPGGTGKTRLSLALAESVLTAFSHAVWFVPLADVSDAALVLLAIRDALQIPASAEDPLEQIAALLASEPALLVLDNFEQLGQEGAGAVSALLRRAPRLRCVVTSRQRLELEGEHEIAVPPLPVPGSRTAPEELVNFASVQLFVDRAQAVRSGFELTEVNRASVAELCRRLEGVPLAIALSAARANVSTPREILESLAERLDFAATAGEPVPDRHRTLRAAIEWSYDFLPPALQTFFANLAVFRGGWTAEAAAAVAAPHDLAGVSGA
jgi:class 3 adenylate cyclase